MLSLTEPETSAWIGTRWEFFDDESAAQARYEELEGLKRCPTMRPFYGPHDGKHLGAGHDWIDSMVAPQLMGQAKTPPIWEPNQAEACIIERAYDLRVLFEPKLGDSATTIERKKRMIEALDAALDVDMKRGRELTGGGLPPAFAALPIVDTRSPERKARYAEAEREIAEGRYERPAERTANVSPPRELRHLVQSVLAWDHDCADCEPAKEFHTGTLYHEKECAYWGAVTALAAAVGLGDMFARETAEQLDGKLGYRRVRFAEDRRSVEPRMADVIPKPDSNGPK